MPVVIGEKDLLRVAQMLPGVQNVGEGSAGFNVRGSPADLTALAGRHAFQTTDHTYPSASCRHDYRIDHYEAQANISWITGLKHSVNFGAGMIHYRLDRGDIPPKGPESSRIRVSRGNESGIESALYIADEYKWLPLLTLCGGMKYSIYTYLGPGTIYDYFGNGPRDPANIADTLRYSTGEPIKTYSGPKLRWQPTSAQAPTAPSSFPTTGSGSTSSC